LNRAQRSLAAIQETVQKEGKEEEEAVVEFGIGIEGGVQKIGDKWFECGWVCVVDKNVSETHDDLMIP
jgi:non-canonical (house-cleaning) NTP pyrophosphatase